MIFFMGKQLFLNPSCLSLQLCCFPPCSASLYLCEHVFLQPNPISDVFCRSLLIFLILCLSTVSFSLEHHILNKQGTSFECNIFPLFYSSYFAADKADDELEMTMVCHRPEGLDQLEAQTNFTKQELQILYRGFKNVFTHYQIPLLRCIMYPSTKKPINITEYHFSLRNVPVES